jgi:hypothetical protein
MHSSSLYAINSSHSLFLYLLHGSCFNYLIPCDHILDYTQQSCGGPCAYQIKTLSIFDGFANGIVSTLLITLFNILLIILVIKQRQCLHQQMQ